MMSITVKEIEDGEFQVVKGGDVYRKTPRGPVPGTVTSGETVSASEICEWIELGIAIEDAPARVKAAFTNYGQHSTLCAWEARDRYNVDPCDCGFDKVRASVSVPF
jgi:hypothetical protein